MINKGIYLLMLKEKTNYEQFQKIFHHLISNVKQWSSLMQRNHVLSLKKEVYCFYVFKQLSNNLNLN